MSPYLNFKLEVAVVAVRPRVWRRILVPSDITLARLHAVIQAVMGGPEPRQCFFVDRRGTVYADPAWRDLPGIRAGRRVRLERLLRRPGDRLAYFSGDDGAWEHSVELLGVEEGKGRIARAACLAGSRTGATRYVRRKGGFSRDKVRRALRALRV